MIKFNAPIPPYPNLIYLYHRWGFSELGETSKEQFYSALQQYTELLGLNLYYDLYTSLDDSCFTQNKGAIFVNKSLCFYGENIDTLTLRLKIASLFLDDIHDQNTKWLSINQLSEFFVEYEPRFSLWHMKERFLKVGQSVITIDGINIISLENKNETGVLVQIRNGFNERGHGQLQLGYFHENKKVDLESLCVESSSLMAFEQKTGFFNHGLEPEEIELLCPDPTPEQIAERQKQQSERHNPFEKLNKERELSEQQYLETFNVFKEFRDSGHKLDLSKEYTAKKLGIGKSTVHKRLKKAVEQELIAEQDIK